MTLELVISDYLTEISLGDSLMRVVGVDQWRGGQIRVAGCRKRWDMGYLEESTLVVVEYDGDEHYCNSLKIKGDREKDAIANSQGWRTVRIPYWVQLDTLTLKHYFNLDACINTSFPHGFITTKYFPASYCELGIARFEQELSALPATVKTAVIDSLEQRASQHGIEFVLPSKLRYLLA